MSQLNLKRLVTQLIECNKCRKCYEDTIKETPESFAITELGIYRRFAITHRKYPELIECSPEITAFLP